MQITWDEGFDEQPTGQVERMDVPEGVHEFQIREVIQHPDKLELRLVHDDRRYGWVFCHLMHGAPWAKKLARQLGQAFDMTPAQWAELDPTDLASRRVRAQVYHRQVEGRLFVNVSSFLPPLAIQDEPPARRRQTVAEKVKAVSTEVAQDDIPF